jgi:hypothetical protein
MIRILNGENGGFWCQPDKGEPFDLHQNNTMLNLHRAEAYKDRFAIIEGEIWNQWWRSDETEETFDQMENIGLVIGTVLLRETATVALNALFDTSHQLTDSDVNHLLDEDAA